MTERTRGTMAERERAALADALLTAGADAPTLCEGWTTRDLARHLVLREGNPEAVARFAAAKLPALRGRLPGTDAPPRAYADVVEQFRSGPPPGPLGLPGVDVLVNTAEHFVHHEDVRRAQPGWEPRDLPRPAQDQLWTAAGLFARKAAGRRGLVLRRSDVPGVEKRYGAGGRTVIGEPLELVLWASGRRDLARVSVD